LKEQSQTRLETNSESSKKERHGSTRLLLFSAEESIQKGKNFASSPKNY